MSKSLDKLSKFVTGSDTQGAKITGGFGSLKGGAAPLPSVNKACTNDTICSNTNVPNCTNSNMCQQTANTSCSNTGFCGY